MSSQIPQGFNYQAIARDGSGNPITNATIKIKLSILTDTSGFYVSGSGTYLWEEEQTGIKTNAFGLFTVVFGNSLATKVIANCTVASFSAIDWAKTPLYIGTKIANPTDYKNLGSAQLWSVPYAMVSDSTKSLLKGSKLSVVSPDDAVTDALFEVKRKDGQTVFAVYPNAVNIYVPRTTPKGVKGGFAIGGFDGSKTDPQDYFRVTPDSIRMYIDKTPNLVKGTTKGGFAIGGFDQVKGWRHDLFTVSKDSVRVYIDKTPSVKGATKGGFAIGGYDEGKGGFVTQDLLTVSNDSIRMYINDVTGPGKGTTKGGFAIGGFGTEKGVKKFLNVETDTTGKINPSVNRILWYPIKNAFLAGRVLVEDHDSVGVNSFSSGFETKSVGNYSQSLGIQSVARGYASTAIGISNIASGTNSFALGYQCKATGENAFAFGDNSESQGPYSYAIGYYNKAVNGPCYAFGDKTQALYWGATTFGWYTKANGAHSFAMGSNTYSNAYCGLVLGQANDTTVLHWIRPGTVAWGSYNWYYGDDPVFTIGNGDVNRYVEPPVVTRMSNAFIILKNGKTGINMNYPSYYLDVKGRGRFIGMGTETAGFYLSKDDGTLRSFIGMMDDNYSGFYGSGGAGWSLVVNADNGNVGIGTNNPQANLEVQTSGINRLAGIAITSTNTNGKQISLNQGEAGKLNITAPGIDLATFDFINNRVGIKSTSPAYDLEVLGTAGKTGGGSWSTSSDLRLKKINGEYTHGIAEIMKLKPILFNYKEGNMRKLPSNEEYIGFVAQDVQLVFPEAVKAGVDGYLDFNMHPVNVAMVNAIQQEQREIESLKSENQQLKSELQSLQARLEQIEATLAWSGSK